MKCLGDARAAGDQLPLPLPLHHRVQPHLRRGDDDDDDDGDDGDDDGDDGEQVLFIMWKHVAGEHEYYKLARLRQLHTHE